MAYGWQNSCQLRSCNYLQNVGATTYKKFLQFYAKKACKKQLPTYGFPSIGICGYRTGIFNNNVRLFSSAFTITQ